MLELKAASLEPYGTNSYLLACPKTRQALLIDPGGEAEAVFALCAGFDVQRILITHGHGDHILALEEARTTLNVPVAVHPADAEAYDIAADISLENGMRLEIGEQSVEVVHIPGHSPGSVALRFDQRAVVGDAVFPGGPGATRDPQALETSLISLQRTVFTWPDETALHPGHGTSTTVGAERPAFQAFLARPRPDDLCGSVTW